MIKYFSKLSKPPNRKITLILLITGLLFIIAGLIIGIADNPPGIVVMFVGIILLLFAFIHVWRKSKPYLILMLVSFFGGIIFAILHNLFDGLATYWAEVVLIPQILNGLAVGSFIIAVLICPVGIFVGFLGAVLTYFLKRNPKTTAE
jgi:predicted MFS family arabinose efflux permease